MKAKSEETLFYDGTCRMCLENIRRLQPILKAAGVETKPFENGAIEPEMKLRLSDGRIVGGADAAFFLARRVWWLAPLGWLQWVPTCRWVARKLYEKIAANRHCMGTGGTCRI